MEADGVSVKLDGFESLGRILHNLPNKFARRALVKAGNAAKKIWTEAMMAAAPVFTGANFSFRTDKNGNMRRVVFANGGELRMSIAAKITFNASKGSLSVKVGPRYTGKGSQDPGVYGMWVEFGSVHNQPPHPFVRKTFDETKDAALNAFCEVLRGEMLGAIADSM